MIETLSSFFAVGAIGFFIYIALLSVIFTMCVEQDEGYTIATFFAIIGVIIYHKSFVGLIHHWEVGAIIILAYGVLGAMNSLFRWSRFCKKYVEKMPFTAVEKECTVADNRLTWIKAELAPSRHKSRLISWIVFWPWSVLWNVVGDFFTMIYERLTGLYRNIANKIIDDAFKTIK